MSVFIKRFIMQTTHIARPLSLLALVGLSVMLVGSFALWRWSARAAFMPTTVTVCKQVEDNGDADHAQGGTFGFIVSNQAVTLGSPSLTRVENQSANPPVCSAPIAVPGGSTQLQVTEATLPPTTTWPRNEGGYPLWTATNGTTTINGSGNTPADISTLTGNVTITFSNRVGRKLTLCKLVQPNAILPNNQGATWDIQASFPPVNPNLTQFPITADETSGTVCLPPINIPAGATHVNAREFFNFTGTQFPGFPKYAWTTTGGQSANGSADLQFSIPTDTTSGDITVTFTNKLDEPRVLNVCTQLLNNGDATSDDGEFRFMTSIPEFPATIFSTLGVTEGGPVVCSNQGSFNVPSSVSSFKVGASQYHANWPGNAIGYPKWELRDGNNPATLLASGTGDYTTVDFAALGVSNVRFVMIHQAGAFGNGSDPTTGKIMRICKQVDNNGDATDDGVRFRFVGLEFGVFNTELGVGILFDKTVRESDGLVCDMPVAVHNGETEFQVKEAPAILGWPGHASGYPNWEVLNPANTQLQSSLAVHLPNRYGEYLAAQINTTTLTGDSTFVMHNKAGNRKLTMCVNVMDNGFAPVDSAIFQLGFLGSEFQDTALTPEGSSNCVVFGAPSSSTEALTIYIPNAPWPGFAYGFPTYSYTTTGLGSGSGSLPDSGPYFFQNFNFADPANAGDVTFNFTVKPARRLTVCKQLLNNGDGIDNSGTFLFGQGTNRDSSNVNLTATEGGAVVCSPAIGLGRVGSPNQAFAQELSSPANWPGNTPGFPLFNWTTTGGQSGTGSGNSVFFDLSNTPGVTGIENTTGDITVTFLNRTGPLRVLTLCKDVENNGDAILNQGGAFTLTGGGNAGTPSIFPLTQTEGQPRVCSPPITLDPLATTISASETAPGTWPGNAFGFPQWTLLDGANATVTAGTGTPTSNLLLSSFTGNPTIIFRNRATLAETGVCTNPPTGMVSWWPGAGNTNDVKDGNSGSLVGGTTFAAGKVGNAFQLDGIDDHVLVTNSANLNFGTGDFSLEAWVKTSFIGGTGNKFIVSKMSVGQDVQYLLAYQANTDGKAFFMMGNGAMSTFALSPTSIADGLFHHLVGVRQGLNLQLYVDGALAASALMPSLYSATSANNVVIGGRQDPGNTPYVNGLIDEATIYNRALSASEILSIVLAGNAGKCPDTPPTITCPNPIMVNNDPGQCSASVNFNVTATGTPSPTVTCRIGMTVITSPHIFPVGVTTVTCTASNGALPDGTCSFTVKVNDTQAPTVTVPANITMPATTGTCAATVTFSATAADNCSGATVSCMPASNTSFNVGTTTVSCKATDVAGNMSAASTFTVTVTDTQPPTVTVPANITMPAAAGTCAATVTFSATAADNCSGATVSCMPASNTSFNVGTTTVSCKATDGAGNMSAATTFTVTVTDTQAPTVTVPANITMPAAAGTCAATVTFSATAADNCAGATVSCMPASNTSFNLGTTTVSCKATDGAGSMSAAKTFTVTVTDTTAPMMSCPANQTAASASGNPITVTYATPTATDNCGAPTVTCLPASGFSFPVGTTTVTCTAKDAAMLMATCSFTVTVTTPSTFVPAPTMSLVDPLACNGTGDLVNGSFGLTNTTAVAQTGTVTTALPAAIVGLPNTCVANVGTCTINATTVMWNGTLTAGQTLTVSYQAQLSNQAVQGQTACAVTTAVFGAATGTVEACLTINCPPAGPGALPNAQNQLSDQKPGSVLIYPVYTSDAANSTAQNTRMAITNTNPSRPAFIHLFFVDGNSCSVADSFICLTPNQTAAVLAADIDPGTTGYVIAIATDRNGCPINFNYLIGDEYVKFASGHQANLAAESIAAVAGGLTACNENSDTAQLNFNGTSYNALPRVLAASNLPSRGDGNDTMLIVNRIGGNLGTGAATLGTLFGILYDDAEKTYSFSLLAATCQSRGSLTNDRPRTVPRYETIIGSGRSGWLKIYGGTDIGILGAQINRNANAASNAGAFNQGHNLHKLTLITTASYTIPVFPPSC